MPLEKSTHQHASASSTTEAAATSSSGASAASSFFEKAVPSASSAPAFLIYELPQDKRGYIEKTRELRENIGESIASLSDDDDRKTKGQKTQTRLDGEVYELSRCDNVFACCVGAGSPGRLVCLAYCDNKDCSVQRLNFGYKLPYINEDPSLYTIEVIGVDPTYPDSLLAILTHIINQSPDRVCTVVARAALDPVSDPVWFYERIGCHEKWQDKGRRLTLELNPLARPDLWTQNADRTCHYTPPAAGTREVSLSEGLDIAEAMQDRIKRFMTKYRNWARDDGTTQSALLDELIGLKYARRHYDYKLFAYFVGDDPVGLICAASFPNNNNKESSWCMAGGVIVFPGYDEKEVHRSLLEAIVNASGHGKIHIPCQVASACGQTRFFEEEGFLFKSGKLGADACLALDAKKSSRWENEGRVFRCTGIGRGQQNQSQSSHSDQPNASRKLAR